MAALVYQRPTLDTAVHQLYQKSMSKDRESADQPPPFRGEFSFVNKDAGNISSKDHNAAVSWHVMNRYERWKKQEQAKRLRASANVPVGPFSSPSHLQSQIQARQQQSVRRAPYEIPKRSSLTGDTTMQTSATPTVAPLGFDPWIAELPQPLQLDYPGINTGQASGSRLPTLSTSPHSPHSEDSASLLGAIGTPLDLTGNPFESSVPSMPPLVDQLVGFAYDVFIPQSWPQEFGRVQGSYEIRKCREDTAIINQDSCYANAYLSLLASAMAGMTNDDNLACQSRFFQGQAMTELKSRVARPGPQDLITLKATLKLFSTETLVDNTSVARMHLKMLRKLVNAAGGVIMTDAWFREDLLSCDCYFALKYETRPLFPAREWTPGPLSQPWKARLLSAGIVGDHAVGLDPLIEHPAMKAVVTDLRELFKAHEYIQDHDVPADDQLLRWQQLRKFDCLSRIADHYVNLTIYPHLFQRPHTQAYACVATALMTNMVLGSPEPLRFGLKLIDSLHKKLDESEAEDGSVHPRRLRLWALYVGSLAEKVHPVGAGNEGWFETNYRAQAADLGVASWEDSRKVLRQFIYSDKLHEEIASGRAHRLADFMKGLYSATSCSWRQPMPDTSLVSGGFELEGSPDFGESGASSIAAGKQREDHGLFDVSFDQSPRDSRMPRVHSWAPRMIAFEDRQHCR
ncbi:hypothetical protein A1O3_09953 [Capronia epimyces CBS 606.96]|uniref:Transcription factor domain-containing protein n=1 Tax=Capronia epimyces CBS 606.96 TaxID=1182542 RepID=W9Y5J2_9EURO|nr:uncharacterized protein A1O3_09953 [Capronia epimyces CBS 606.96]EXJ77724.1 hypothetical protein A1O3_09953 [Capronia epimyces CBS 606.96]